uniref:hypothetical protein n=1 Tax=Eubacterium cellulosolvens TaxID=29322 RepID=UPI000AD9B67D|nr:hypothetical protein [[Eubacterium] cellulosolvens]
MKDWEKPRLEAVDFSDTGYGPHNEKVPDSELTQEYDPERGFGWYQLYGEASDSSKVEA